MMAARPRKVAATARPRHSASEMVSGDNGLMGNSSQGEVRRITRVPTKATRATNPTACTNTSARLTTPSVDPP